MQLYTQHNFTVVRQIADHTDATVYYVRAVIRNAYTDAIIETLDLDSKGNQRYKKDWRVPADSSGEGFYISIVTSVYSDSGHTTKSSLYGDEEVTYFVIDKPRVVGGQGFTNNGGGLARRDVRDIISEELQKIIPIITPKETEPIEIPDQKEYDPRFDEVIKAIEEVKKSIQPAEKVDLAPILKNLMALKSLINAIEMPKLDLSPVLSAIKDHLDTNEVTADEIKNILGGVLKDLNENVAKTVTKILEEANFITSSVTFIGGKDFPAMHKKNMEKEEKKKAADEIKNNINLAG